MRIDINQIVVNIKDQGSFSWACYELFEVDAQKMVVTEIATYPMMLIVGLNGVKAERDDANQNLDLDVAPMLPYVLVKLHHGAFVRKMLDPYREHLAKFWLPQNIDQIEANHCTLLKAYNTDNVLRATIDNHGVVTTFNDAWGGASGRYEHLRSFCGGMVTMFTNTTLVKFDFSNLKWEMDASRIALMHLSLEAIFLANHRALL